MNIVEPKVIVQKANSEEILRSLERYGRVCYKSEGSIAKDSYIPFLQKVIANGHHSVLEHEKVTAVFVCDRGVSHEIVRHRIAAYSQESTRYCNYSGDKFGNEITVIRPFFFDDTNSYVTWQEACLFSEEQYFNLIKLGRSPQEARSVLPNSLKTEIVVTYDLREWRHFFSLRADKAAHPQMRQLAIPLLLAMKEDYYPLFDDIGYDQKFAEEYRDQLAKVL